MCVCVYEVCRMWLIDNGLWLNIWEMLPCLFPGVIYLGSWSGPELNNFELRTILCNQKNLKIRLQYLLFHRLEFPEEIPWDCCLRDKSAADVILAGDFMSRELASVPDLWHCCPTLLTSLGQTDSLLLLLTCLCLLSSLGGPPCRRVAGLSPGVWGGKACCLCEAVLITL